MPRILPTARSGLLLLTLACGAPVTIPSPSLAPVAEPSSAADRLVWGAYQLNAEPHYRLIFEGGATGLALNDARIVDPSGVVRASAPFSSSSSDPMQLCPGGKGTPGPTAFRAWRATLAVDAELFRDFLDSPLSYRVEAQVAGTWKTVALTYLCAATE